MRGTHSANSLRNPWSGIIPAYAGNTSHQHAERRSAWDHPRVCGEHHGSGLYSGCAAGSSPRMRGTHRRGTRSETAQGIIPAYAGNTSQCAALRALLRDHPRVCGEHRSPVSWRIPPTRIIPAYAGNTRFAQQICCVYRDHPRVCGEHIAFVPAITVVVGSSPRMRGTLHDWPIQVVVEGIIPAYAGNTPKRRSVAPRSRDHPRVCGEHRPAISKLTRALGSSPRMRGTRYRMVFATPVCGIIPAYAGNTRSRRGVRARKRDHPRVCGEHTCLRVRVLRIVGSSPRMRGTQSQPLLYCLQSGIIPAYAGNTCQSDGECYLSGDHPRVCGEHTLTEQGIDVDEGSSPRMRGTPYTAGFVSIMGGIIPAYAGNTFQHDHSAQSD